MLDPRPNGTPGEVFDVDTAVFNRLRTAIEGTDQDLVLFFHSALRLLGIAYRGKPTAEVKTTGVTHVYEIEVQGERALALLADLDGLLDAATLDAVTGAALEEAHASARVVKALLVANHQRHLRLSIRDRIATTSDAIATKAARRGISVLTTADLWEWLVISRGSKERYRAVREMIERFPAGRIGPHHPHFRPIGVVRHYYERVGAVSIQLDTTESIAVGMFVAIRLTSGFKEVECTEMQMNRCPVQQAPRGALIAIKFDCVRGQICLGEVAFQVQN